MEPTVLIIGAGTFGTSTAYHLSKTYRDPSRVTVIDRSPSPPIPAASIDVNRIIRTDYPNKLYCNLANEAIHSWFWSVELGAHFHKTGWVMMDEKGGDLAKRIREVFEERGSTHTHDVELEKVKEKWEVLKGTDVEGFGGVYWNPEAGWCDAASATASLMAAAERRGVKKIVGDVTEFILDRNNGHIEGVRTNDGRVLKADKIVLSVGAWTSYMLSPLEDKLDIPEQDRVERQVQATGTVSVYYKLSNTEVDRLTKANMPIIVYGGHGEVIPPTGRDSRLLKYNNSQTTFINSITTKSGHRISTPPINRNQREVPEGIKSETKRILTSKLLPELTRGLQPEFWRICWDAVTPSEDLLLCKHPHPQLSNLYISAGGSFHGYKFVPGVLKFHHFSPLS